MCVSSHHLFSPKSGRYLLPVHFFFSDCSNWGHVRQSQAQTRAWPIPEAALKLPSASPAKEPSQDLDVMEKAGDFLIWETMPFSHMASMTKWQVTRQQQADELILLLVLVLLFSCVPSSRVSHFMPLIQPFFLSCHCVLCHAPVTSPSPPRGLWSSENLQVLLNHIAHEKVGCVCVLVTR